MKSLVPAVALCTLALVSCQPPAPPTEAMISPAYIKAVALLKTQSRSPDPSIRANCIEALQLARDPRAINVIEQGLHDPEWVVRFSAAMASGKRKARSVLPILETMAVVDTDGSVRVAAVYALRRMDRPARMSDLASAMQSRDPSERANTALVLGLLEDESAIPLLQAHRDEPDIRVRFEITAALARLGDLPAQQIIVGWAVNRFAEDQWNAMQVCADLPPEIATSPLLIGLEPIPAKLASMLPQNVTEAEVQYLTTRRQLVAARSLAKRRNGAGATVALNNLKNPAPELRALALLALGDMLTSAQVPGIEAYMDEPDAGVRRAAAAAIVNVFSRSSTPG